jgi:hypothetical protein
MSAHDTNLIPESFKGIKTDTFSERKFASVNEAEEAYQVFRGRLLQVSEWKKWSGTGTADFTLTDSSGRHVNREVQQGDFFRISIPGPGSDAGEGYDWVEVLAVTELEDHDYEQVAIKVKPAANPADDSDDTAHFFDSDASSTFIVKRQGDQIFAEVHGRNEKPNTDTSSLTDKVRNTLIALGAIAGASKFQWKSLTNGLLQDE